jgi:opacity protein-like surface antigen
MKLKSTKTNIQCFLFGMLLLSFALSAKAKDEVTTSIIEFSPAIGYYEFDSKRELSNREMAGLGFGIHVSRRWAMILNYTALNTVRGGAQQGETVDVQKYHFDVYRFFLSQHRFRPYIVIGLGGMDIISEGDKHNETQWNGGLGLSYRITSKWFLRGDGRVFYSDSSGNTDYAYTLTLGFRLKEGERGP